VYGEGEKLARRLNFVSDCLQYTVERVNNLFVLETNDPETLRFQKFLANSVFFSGVLVDLAVDFDNQTRLSAIEIHNKATDWVLPPDRIAYLVAA
jgi:hypothetical protein